MIKLNRLQLQIQMSLSVKQPTKQLLSIQRSRVPTEISMLMNRQQQQQQQILQQADPTIVDPVSVINNLLSTTPPEQLFDICEQLKTSSHKSSISVLYFTNFING